MFWKKSPGFSLFRSSTDLTTITFIFNTFLPRGMDEQRRCGRSFSFNWAGINSARGQVTIFLIVGIVILFVFAGGYYITSKMMKAPLSTKAEQQTSEMGIKERVTSFVTSCLRETSIAGVHLLAAGGGIIYPDFSKPILLTDFGMVNYASLNGVDGLSREKMEQDLEMFTVKTIPVCFRDFQPFEEQGIKIKVEYASVSAQYRLTETALDVVLKIPMEITTPTGDVIEMKNFEAKIQTSLLKMTNAAEKMNDQTLLLSPPYTFTVFPFDEKTTIYALTDEKSPEQTPLTLLFAVRNDSLSLRSPELEFISDKTFRVGQQWKDVLAAKRQETEELTFHSDSSDFPVSADGTIDLIIPPTGTYTVTFSVKTKRGLSDQQKVTIHVLEQQDQSISQEYTPPEIPEETIDENIFTTS